MLFMTEVNTSLLGRLESAFFPARKTLQDIDIYKTVPLLHGQYSYKHVLLDD